MAKRYLDELDAQTEAEGMAIRMLKSIRPTPIKAKKQRGILNRDIVATARVTKHILQVA